MPDDSGPCMSHLIGLAYPQLRKNDHVQATGLPKCPVGVQINPGTRVPRAALFTTAKRWKRPKCLIEGVEG